MHLELSMLRLVANIQQGGISHVSRQTQEQPAPYRILKMGVHKASTVVDLASSAIHVAGCYSNWYIKYSWSSQANQSLIYMLLCYEIEHQQSPNNFWSGLLGNQDIVQLLVLITEVLTAFICRNTIYNFGNHWFQNHRYCKVQNMQKVITGYWISDFDNILLLNSKNTSSISIYSLPCWATYWEPTPFRQVGWLPWNYTWIDDSSESTIRTSNLATVWFEPGSGPEEVVWNHCQHYILHHLYSLPGWILWC